MTTYIAILRGINVSGQKMIKMDTLRQLFFEIDLKNVHTYIQSGNVIFQDKSSTTAELENKISTKIADAYHFNVPVIVKKIFELKEITRNNPFFTTENTDYGKLHVTFLSSTPLKENMNNLIEGKYFPDEFKFGNNAIYLSCPNGYGNTKLSNNFFENKLKVNTTTRNWKTTVELLKIAEQIENER